MAPWTALVVRVPPAVEEMLVGALAWCLQGECRIDPPVARPGDDPPPEAGTGAAAVELWLYLHSPRDERAALERAAAVLAASGLDPTDCGLRAQVVEDGRWVERYQESLRPFDLGSGYRVFPSGRVDEAAGRRALVLVPGRAFGTGEHPTTRLCAAALERHVTPDSRWVDVGCGTAILSIVARGAGAREVLALDDDPEAVEVAATVLAANGVDGITVRCAGAEAAGADRWDGIVANISAAYLVEHAARLADLARPGGLVIASGYTESDHEVVRAAFAAAGLACEGLAVDPPWGLAIFRRDPAGGR